MLLITLEKVTLKSSNLFFYPQKFYLNIGKTSEINFKSGGTDLSFDIDIDFKANGTSSKLSTYDNTFKLISCET